MEPRFFTIPSLAPLPSKRKVEPAMKFWFEMSSEEATKEPPVVIDAALADHHALRVHEIDRARGGEVPMICER